MKLFIFLSLLAYPLLASAKNQYLVSAKYFIGEKLISSPRIMVLEGQGAMIRQASSDGDFHEMNVKVTEESDGDIMLDFDVESSSQGVTHKIVSGAFVKNNEESLWDLQENSAGQPVHALIGISRQ